MNKRAVKVSLNEKASEDLKEIARELGISETEVLRKGLAVMGLYAKLKENEKQGNGTAAILLREGDITRELILA
ncbi:MAG: hypothetical protein KME59_12930 [Trichormus sp. ATA11-4-KO1]|jgi:predicted transcriptional regulator|uniref:hypothetical protein n=1 Tax=Nostoc sp. CCY0012 TaxID=1056123 RepID=UPI002A0906D3|nr:hypothetical protein [Trichormus sp. ATA11-4-KO1]MCG6133528.1 hypothetical protein [Cyanocohniella sp. LLY]